MYVYVISDGDRCQKVGYASDPMRRLKELQTASPFLLELVEAFRLPSVARAREVEKAVHVRLALFELAGEWFDMTADDVIAAVKDVILQPSKLSPAQVRRSLLKAGVLFEYE